MTLSESQHATMEQIDDHGFHFNNGTPCECGEEADYVTKENVGYSDFVTYKHRCRTCGHRFETYIEG